MTTNTSLSLSYQDLTERDLDHEIKSHNEIEVVITVKQADLLKKSWDRYTAYVNAYYSKASSISRLVKNIAWLFSRYSVDSKFHNLDKLTNLYISQGESLQPVEFKDLKDGRIAVYFRKANSGTASQSTVH